ncbi:MAG: radical SAM protein [Bacteroidales bacterium]|nr:radical SAM protein [Bacteroidales bacterium]
MYDSFNREITYLRISVTDRCNLACRYCMPEQLTVAAHGSRILDFNEITHIVRTLAPLGISKIRLTGGEPLVRKGLDELVGMISKVEGIREITMTTNGHLLARMASKLALAGLDRVNISLDTLDPQRYRKITRGGDIRQVKKGIDAALKAGLDPVKINCVITPDTSPEEIENLKKFCGSKDLGLRFIRQMNLGSGKFWKVEGGDGGHCPLCSRIRLTADGRFIPCLFSEKEFDITELGIGGAFRMAIQQKPERGRVNSRSTFYEIGG